MLPECAVDALLGTNNLCRMRGKAKGRETRDLIDQFISQRSRRSSGITDVARYARLYLMYGAMEGEDFDVVKSAHANEAAMRAGVGGLLHDYPKSDFILNVVARFSCIDGDWITYDAIKPRLRSHPSATAWPDQLSIAECDLRASYDHQLATSPTQ